MAAFDARSLAAAVRAGPYAAIDRPPSDFDAAMRGRVAAFAVHDIVGAWLVGERALVTPRLARAAEWLEESDLTAGDFDPEGAFGVQRRRRALALVRWFRGEDAVQASRGAAQAGEAHLSSGDEAAPWEFADCLLDRLLGGDAAGVVEAGGVAAGLNTGDLTAGGAQEVEILVDLARGEARPVSLAAFLSRRIPDWAAGGDHLRLASWCRLLFAPFADDAEGALLTAWCHLPNVELPPGLLDRGWSGRNREIVMLPQRVSVARVDGMASRLGLVRERGAPADDGGAAASVSWAEAGAPDAVRRSMDWREADEMRWLELQGPHAGVWAGTLALSLGGEMVVHAATTVVRHLGATRWSVLRGAIASTAAANTPLVQALLSAGLDDPDWRTRMTAALAVGRLRIGALAAACRAAQPPLPAEKLVSQEERRCLLVLRDAAAMLAEGRDAGQEGNAARRAAFAEARAILTGGSEGPWTRMRALAAVLLGDALPEGAPIPSEWRRWMADGRS